MKILVTGGAGFIGSHTCFLLIKSGYEIIILDNFANSNIQNIKQIEHATKKKILFFNIDIRDTQSLDYIFKKNSIYAILHFAGLKSVQDSQRLPDLYYDVNVTGTLNLLKIMSKNNLKKLIFSSSATVYDDNCKSPLLETMLTNGGDSTYGHTKHINELILKDFCSSDPSWTIIALRYFNPIGAHPDVMIGEPVKKYSSNLMPKIIKVALKEEKQLKIFGNNYNTKDGTAVRDFIHILDLANGHISALDKINVLKGFNTFNLGTGKGTTVLELVKRFEFINKISIPFISCPKRPGDKIIAYADVAKAKKILNWSTKYSIDEMCKDSWLYTLQSKKLMDKKVV